MSARLIPALLTATAVSLASITPVLAQNEAAEFFLELNAAADTNTGDCRLTYVATNRTGAGLDQASYEVAVFNGSGIVSRILVLAFGALPEGKTRVVQFDIAGQTCTDTSRILVNNIADCAATDPAGASDVCLSALTTSSRSAIQFGQ